MIVQFHGVSKKQYCIALSTMEVEYVAYSSAKQEAVWLRRFLLHLEIVKTTSEPMTIYCDRTAVLAYVKDPKYHGKTKHIQIRYHFARNITQNEVVMRQIPTSKMVEDPFTKPIVRDAFVRHVKSPSLYRI